MKKTLNVVRNFSLWFLLPALLLFTTTGCQVAQSSFSNAANNAGASFAAASTTLSYFHEDKITAAYARSSFINYQSELSGLDQSLPSLHGVPDRHTLQELRSSQAGRVPHDN